MTMDELREETARQMELTPTNAKDKNKNALVLRIIIYSTIIFFLYNTYITKIQNENISISKLYHYALSYYKDYDKMAQKAYVLNRTAYNLIQEKKYREANKKLYEVISKYTKIDDEKVKEQVLYANLNLIWTLQKLNQHTTVLKVANRFLKLYQNDNSGSTQVTVAQAMGLKAWSEKQLNDRKLANRTYHQLIAKFAKNKNPKIQAEVSRALYNRGHNYMMLKKFKPALADFDAQLRLSKKSKELYIREDRAAAMADKAYILDQQGKHKEAKQLKEKLFVEFAKSDSKLISDAIQRALKNY